MSWLQVALAQSPLIFAGLLLGPKEAAVLGPAFRVAGLITLGLAAVNTANNLLYLVLFIVVVKNILETRATLRVLAALVRMRESQN